ncbi:hypothetical protein EJ896_08865 [Klebsiella quasipneumoniae subsp. similipneumoniae]|nr:hypothetical protein EJ896_08865 [Klebsiella quasipneumoniae subsp. similipneumoniae]
MPVFALTLTLSRREREPSGASLNTSAGPPFSLSLWERAGVRGNASPFFESHHNHRTPLFPFSPRRLN